MDIWSCGVIMGELFKYISKPVQDANGEKKRPSLQIFNGYHCFPASPRDTTLELDGFPPTEGHVLDSIFDLLGTPTELDACFVNDEKAL